MVDGDVLAGPCHPRSRRLHRLYTSIMVNARCTAQSLVGASVYQYFTLATKGRFADYKLVAAIHDHAKNMHKATPRSGATRLCFVHS